MATGKNQPPQQVKLNEQEVSDLKDRIQKNDLTKSDIKILLNLITFNLWLQQRLSRAKLTIKRLRQLFGFNNESQKKSKKSDSSDKPDEETDADDDGAESDEVPLESSDENTTKNKSSLSTPQWNPEKNHGRTAASDYTGCPVIDIPFDDEHLKEGKCPKCAECKTEAKIYEETPTVLVFLDSQPLVSGERYHLKKGRCSICETYFTAPLPEALKEKPKYSHRCITAISIAHYYSGTPFKRIETLQRLQGVPLADATQYDLMNTFYGSTIEPVVGALRQCAANGNSLFFDDTPGRILEQIAHNKNISTEKNKKSIHTTALLSEYKGHRIYLFNTNTLTAGKQFAELLNDRTSTDDFATMSDASANNFPMLDDSLLARWVITLCLAHGRRRFVELLGDADEDAQFILTLIGRVYQNEKHCKQAKLTDEERLTYHQTHSAPVMSAMQIWLNNLLLYKEVEPNSRLGEAITYMLKRWQWLTQFLRVPGAQLDNNICELAIKVKIRYRKNSLFYRSFYGANIGDAMMSLLHTAAHANVNIFTYFNTLQQYAKHVRGSPENWLPWNYQQTLATLTEQEVTAAVA